MPACCCGLVVVLYKHGPSSTLHILNTQGFAWRPRPSHRRLSPGIRQVRSLRRLDRRPYTTILSSVKRKQTKCLPSNCRAFAGSPGNKILKLTSGWVSKFLKFTVPNSLFVKPVWVWNSLHAERRAKKLLLVKETCNTVCNGRLPCAVTLEIYS